MSRASSGVLLPARSDHLIRASARLLLLGKSKSTSKQNKQLPGDAPGPLCRQSNQKAYIWVHAYICVGVTMSVFKEWPAGHHDGVGLMRAGWLSVESESVCVRVLCSVFMLCCAGGCIGMLCCSVAALLYRILSSPLYRYPFFLSSGRPCSAMPLPVYACLHVPNMAQ